MIPARACGVVFLTTALYGDQAVKLLGWSVPTIWETIAAKVEPAHAAVISGATGIEPATSAERHVLGEIGLPVRNTGTYIGHGIEAQFPANLAIGCAVLAHGKLLPPAGSGDRGQSPPSLSQLIVTGVGSWRGEGLALLERVD